MTSIDVKPFPAIMEGACTSSLRRMLRFGDSFVGHRQRQISIETSSLMFVFSLWYIHVNFQKKIRSNWLCGCLCSSPSFLHPECSTPSMLMLQTGNTNVHYDSLSNYFQVFLFHVYTSRCQNFWNQSTVSSRFLREKSGQIISPKPEWSGHSVGGVQFPYFSTTFFGGWPRLREVHVLGTWVW